MASVETLEDRAAPSDSLGAVIGMGLAAELLASGTADTSVAAEVSVEANSQDDPFAPAQRDHDEQRSAIDSLLDEAESAAGVSAASAPFTSDLLIPADPPAGLVPTLSDALGPLTDARIDLFSTAAFADHSEGSPTGIVPDKEGRISLVPEPQRAASPVSVGTAPAGLVAAGAAAPTTLDELTGGDQAASIQFITPSSPKGGSGGGGVQTFSSNSPPVAVDDIGYSGKDAEVEINVIANDTDPDFDPLTVTSVTQPANGSAVTDGANVIYTPNPGFVSGTDTLDYTIDDGNGGTDTGTLTLTMVEVTGYTLERKESDGSWTAVPAGEIVWSHEHLRWTAHYSPSEPDVINTMWLAKPWADVDDPQVPWGSFAMGAGTGPHEGNPGSGDWAITPEIYFFGTPANQTTFAVMMAQPNNQPDAEIISVDWVGIDPGDGATNLSNNPSEMGGGSRIFPDRNTATGPHHREVEVKITVVPARMGIPIKLKLFDPDDPTDADGPIDADPNEPDNIQGLPGFASSATTTQIQGNTAIARTTLTVNLASGDNYRVLASRQLAGFGGIEPISSPTNPEVQGRLYKDENGNGTFDGEDPYIDETRPLWIDNGPAVYSTPLLTVWRRLNVEVDSMGAPPANTAYGLDDPAIGNDGVASPPTGGLADAFRPAFIEVNVLPGAPNGPSDSNTPFHLDSNNQPGFDDLNQLVNYAAAQRGSPQPDSLYWSVYVIGAYEFGAVQDGGANYGFSDNDPDIEHALPGTTHPTEPEYSFIWMEVIRDVATQHGWNAAQIAHVQRLVVVHEIGHQFQLGHPADNQEVFPGHVMTVHFNNASEAQIPQVSTHFDDWDIWRIRRITSP